MQTQSEAASAGKIIVANIRYNGLDQVIQQSLPYEVTAALGAYQTPNWSQPKTQTSYDGLGRVLTVTNLDGSQRQTRYRFAAAMANREIGVVDELGHQEIQEIDPFGRLVKAKQYTVTVTGSPPEPNWSAAVYAQASYEYDVADRLERLVGPDSAETTIVYDALGRKTSMSDPDMGVWLYRYDAGGNLRKQRDAANVMTCFHYDSLNRLVGKSFHPGFPDPDQPAGYCATISATDYDVSYGYDSGVNGIGQRTGMVDGSGSTSWEYDARGRMFRETKSIAGWRPASQASTDRVWVYDSMDRVAEAIVDNADGFYHQYDASGRLYQVRRLGNEQVTLFYNALGQVTERRLGYQAGMPYPELRQTFTYPIAQNFRLTSLRSGYSPNYSNLQNISYTYDSAGNVLTIADSVANGGSQTQTFTYDALNRLLTARATGGSNGAYGQRSYGYNNAGNMTTFEGTALHYLDTAHSHAVTHVGGTAPAQKKYWYDVNGNATRRINGSQDITLAYDAENRLTSVSGSGVNASYVYDGDGQLVKATVNGLTSFYPYPELEVIETAPGVFREKYYMIVGGARLSVQDRSAWPPVKNYWLLGDHLGSTAITVDGATGNRVTELRYYPYGSARYDAGSQLTNYWFTGQRRESSTGLYFYQSRWYDPLIGRFLAADTIVPEPGDPQSLNRYSYVNNRPTVLIDPTGNTACAAVPHPVIMGICWLGEQILQHGPQIINLIQQLTIVAPQLPALVDQAAQAGQASQPASSNAGNTAGPGGLDPNDPLFRALIQQTGESDPIKAIARASIEGPAREGASNGTTVLGRYPAYVNTANDLRANYLNFAEGTWDKLTDAQRWAVNRQFLDDAIARGDTFRLASQLKLAEPGTYYRRELDYLFSLGYEVVDDILVKVR